MRRTITGRPPAGWPGDRRPDVGRPAWTVDAGAIGSITRSGTVGAPRAVTGTRTVGPSRTTPGPWLLGPARAISSTRLSGATRPISSTGLSGTMSRARAGRLRALDRGRTVGRFRPFGLRRSRGGPRRFAGADPCGRPLWPRPVDFVCPRGTAQATAGPPDGSGCGASPRCAAEAPAAAPTHAPAETTAAPGLGLADPTVGEDTRRFRRQNQCRQRDENDQEELLHSRRLISPNRGCLLIGAPSHRLKAQRLSRLPARLPPPSRPWPSWTSARGN
jgi:hypothetical protein